MEPNQEETEIGEQSEIAVPVPPPNHNKLKLIILNLVLFFGIVAVSAGIYTDKYPAVSPSPQGNTWSTPHIKDDKTIPIAFIDKDWKIPDKNRLYSVRCTKADPKDNDFCFITIAELKKPESERILSAVSFPVYEGGMSDHVNNHVKIIGLLKDWLILYITQSTKSDGDQVILMSVDVGSGEQKIITKNAARYSRIFTDGESKTLFYGAFNQIQDISELHAYNAASGEDKVVLTSTVDVDNFPVAKLRDGKYLVTAQGALGYEAYKVCRLINNICELSDLNINSKERISFKSYDSETNKIVFSSGSNEYWPQHYTVLQVDYPTMESKVLVDVTNKLAAKPDPDNDYPYIYPGNELLGVIVSPTKSIAIAAIAHVPDPTTLQRNVRADYPLDLKVVNVKNKELPEFETDLMKKIEADPTDSKLWDTLTNSTWIRYISENGSEVEGMIRSTGTFGDKRYDPLVLHEGFDGQAAEAKLNTNIDGYDLWESGPNTIKSFLFDPVVSDGQYFLKRENN